MRSFLKYKYNWNNKCYIGLFSGIFFEVFFFFTFILLICTFFSYDWPYVILCLNPYETTCLLWYCDVEGLKFSEEDMASSFEIWIKKLNCREPEQNKKAMTEMKNKEASWVNGEETEFNRRNQYWETENEVYI